MTVYADVLFLTNCFMDYLLLTLTAKCCNVRPRAWRLWLAGVLGGLYGVFMFVPDFSIFYTLPAKILAAGVLCGAGFCPCRPRRFLRLWGMFLAVHFLSGGILYCIMLYTGGGMVKNGVMYMQAAWIPAGAVLAKVVISRGVRCFRRQTSRDIYNVELFYGECHARAEGFVDTGNSLTDPTGKLPVILADARVLQQLFHADCNSRNLAEWVGSTDLRCIPYRTIDNSGIMYGFCADRVLIDGRDLGRTVVVACDRQMEYGVLLHPEIMLEGV